MRKIIFLSLIIYLSFLSQLSGQCPQSPDCGFTFASYGSGNDCDNECILPYTGMYGRLRIPVKVFRLGTNLVSTIGDLETQFSSINSFLNTSSSLHHEFYIQDVVNLNSSFYNDYCNNTATIDPVLIDSIQSNPYCINLFIPDCMSGFGNAGYPSGNPLPSIDTSNWFFVKDSVVAMNYWAVTAHELGHLFGLFHTFETDAFPIGCTDSCDEGDGMEDVPFDAGGWTPGDPSPVNIMDYDEIAIDPLVDPFIEISLCQKVKFQQLLFWCRNNLCSNPLQPDVQLSNGQSINALSYNRGNDLDTLYAFLPTDHRTNTGNYAQFKLRNSNGVVLYSSFAHSIDLNSVIALPNVPDYGAFTIEVRDSSFYNNSCISQATIITLTIDPCNEDGICDPIENFQCSDCQFSNGSPRPLITQLEYYFDIDPGYGMGHQVAITPDSILDLNVNIDLAELEQGVHTLYFRSKDTTNRWSFNQKKIFYHSQNPLNSSGKLVRLEYYIDSDPGLGLATPLPLANDTNSISNYNISLSNVSPGVHVIYTRAKNDRMQWGFAQKKLVYVTNGPSGNKEIIQLEYFIDTDPGYGLANQIQINADDTLNINHIVNTSGLNGQHRIYVRAKDNWNKWGYTVSDTLVWSNDTIKLLTPNGGQSYTTGGNITNITLTKGVSVGNVTIQLVRPSGIVVQTIATNISSNVYPSWTIPYTVNAGQYKIKVFETDEPSVADYSDNVINISNAAGICSAFTDLSVPGNVLNAASCLCGLSYVTPQVYNSYNNTYGVNPESDILRADLAKLVYYAIYQGNAASVAESFPVPFIDLQNAPDPYFKYAKALSYLQYGDHITPFDRNFINFRPYEPIELKYAAKVIVEAFNFIKNLTNGGPIANISFGEDGYTYLRTLQMGGYLNNITASDANAFAVRKDIFIILKNILDHCGPSCSQSCNDPNPQPTDYFVPGNFSPKNLSRNVEMNDGFFEEYSSSSFNISGVKMPLTFGHSYSSKFTHLPENYQRLKPLGYGWSNSYNAFIFKEQGWNANNQSITDRWVIHWPDGTIHFYDATTRSPLSDGVYDELFVSGTNTIIVKTKNQFKYYFTKYQSPSFAATWLLSKIEDRNGNKITIQIEMTQLLGNPFMPRITKVIGTNGKKLKFNYNSPTSPYIQSVQDSIGNRSISFDYDTNFNLKSYTDPSGKTTQYEYDVDTIPNSASSDHLLYTIIRPEGNKIRNTYVNKFLASNSMGTAAPSTTTINTATNYGTSNPYTTSIIDGEGVNIVFEKDSKGYTKMKKIGNTEMLYSRSVASDPSLITGINYEGLNKSFTYDAKGNALTINMPLGITHTFTYNNFNDVLTYKDPKNQTTTFTYDDYGNLKKRRDNMSFDVDFLVDSKGQLTQIRNPENIIQNYIYDGNGNLKEVQNPLNIKTKISYDAIGRPDSIINPQLQVTKYHYNQTDLATQTIRRSNTYGDIVTSYHYDDNYNLDTIENALGHKTVMHYNEKDQLSEMAFGDDTKLYNYLDDGLIQSFQKPDGHIFNYQYDTLGRFKTDGYVSYEYDQQDNITKVTKADSGHEIIMGYDNVNRLDTLIYGGKQIAYTYDKNNNITKIKYPNNVDVNYFYDANNRLDYITFLNKTIDYSYKKDGRLTGVTMPNGTKREYNYDAAGRMTYMAELLSTNDTICRYFFTLDSLGNHNKELRKEPLGNPPLAVLNRTRAYNNENEENTTGYIYDQNGNRMNAPGQALASSWDDKDMLISHQNKSYKYDGMGLRYEVNNGGNIIKYIWDVRGMGNIIAETDASGNILYYYIHGLGLEARVNAATNAVSYYHSDFRGSTVAITNDQQVMTHKYSYLPFGQILMEQESGPQPFKYIGRFGVMAENDSLYYMRARYLDAISGRFISEDPVWHDNLYPYAGNNPISLVDYNGKNEQTCEWNANQSMSNPPSQFYGAKQSTLGGFMEIASFLVSKPSELLGDFLKDYFIESNVNLIIGDKNFINRYPDLQLYLVNLYDAFKLKSITPEYEKYLRGLHSKIGKDLNKMGIDLANNITKESSSTKAPTPIIDLINFLNGIK